MSVFLVVLYTPTLCQEEGYTVCDQSQCVLCLLGYLRFIKLKLWESSLSLEQT